jgi:hypothetical protein
LPEREEGVGRFIARFTGKRARAEETRERESRVWGIDAFRERERWGHGEREKEWEIRGERRGKEREKGRVQGIKCRN